MAAGVVLVVLSRFIGPVDPGPIDDLVRLAVEEEMRALQVSSTVWIPIRLLQRHNVNSFASTTFFNMLRFV